MTFLCTHWRMLSLLTHPLAHHSEPACSCVCVCTFFLWTRGVLHSIGFSFVLFPSHVSTLMEISSPTLATAVPIHLLFVDYEINSHTLRKRDTKAV